FSFTFGGRPTASAGESLKRHEILHTTIRDVCPPHLPVPGQSHSTSCSDAGLISTGALSLTCSGLFELMASRLGSSAAPLQVNFDSDTRAWTSAIGRHHEWHDVACWSGSGHRHTPVGAVTQHGPAPAEHTAAQRDGRLFSSCLLSFADAIE